VAFTTHANLKYLSGCEILFVDGTFKSCPKMLYQLFTIHGVKNHNYTPLIFFLLTEKTKQIYEDAFTNLLIKMNDLNLNLSPKIIYADFEQAILRHF